MVLQISLTGLFGCLIYTLQYQPTNESTLMDSKHIDFPHADEMICDVDQLRPAPCAGLTRIKETLSEIDLQLAILEAAFKPYEKMRFCSCDQNNIPVSSFLI
ncbi:MAG: hypothetical protein ACI9FJ_003002 [Alteromonadaceae bacterium]|jgi:hypothetical protein